MRHLLLGSMFVGLLLTGCEAYEDLGGSVTILEKDIRSDNGIAMNGFNMNGLKTNGYNLNGYNLNGKYNNGAYLNGQVPNGHYTNGQWVNGQNPNGYYKNGQWSNGAYNNGQWVNGLKLNGLNLNGAYLNGQVPNGAYANGVLTNGAYVNGQWVNGAYNNGQLVNGAYVNGLNANGQFPNGYSLNGLDPATSDNHMKYLTKCSWPAGQTLSFTVNGTTYSYAGALGLGPNFAGDYAMSNAERRAVSACLGAFTNAAGQSVMISLREKRDGAAPNYSVLSADSSEKSTFKYVEAWFFGDHFDENASNEYVATVNALDGTAIGGYIRTDNGRACLSGNPFSGMSQCGFQYSGSVCDNDGNCQNSYTEPGKIYKGLVTYQQKEPNWDNFCNPAGPFVTNTGIASQYGYSYYYSGGLSSGSVNPTCVAAQ